MASSASRRPSALDEEARAEPPPSAACWELPAARRWLACRVEGGEGRWREEAVASEYPLVVRLNGRDIATVVCTPCDLEDLVVGFLTAEGFLCPGDPIASLTVDLGSGVAEVDAPGREPAPEAFGRPFVGSCCGKSRLAYYFEADVRTARPVESDLALEATDCVRLMQSLQAASPVFAATGGVHTAALAGPGGLEAVRIDIGRHNTLDKLYGHALRQRAPLTDRVVAFSGRISSEVLLKVVKMGCPVLLSKSAPTELALRMARDLGVTTVGFLRGESMNVYTHARRIRDLPPTA